jgi:hypothetical protein
VGKPRLSSGFENFTKFTITLDKSKNVRRLIGMFLTPFVQGLKFITVTRLFSYAIILNAGGYDEKLDHAVDYDL